MSLSSGMMQWTSAEEHLSVEWTGTKTKTQVTKKPKKNIGGTRTRRIFGLELGSQTSLLLKKPLQFSHILKIDEKKHPQFFNLDLTGSISEPELQSFFRCFVSCTGFCFLSGLDLASWESWIFGWDPFSHYLSDLQLMSFVQLYW